MCRWVESFNISTINLSIHGSNERFFDKLYEGSRAESSIYVCCLNTRIQKRGGDGLSIYLRRFNKRRHLPEIRAFLLKDRLTDRQTDRQLHFQKQC